MQRKDRKRMKPMTKEERKSEEDQETTKKEEKEVVEQEVITEKQIEEVEKEKIPIKTTDVGAWVPKTALGKKVKAGEITTIDQILNSGQKILEIQIVDTLFPTLESDLLMIGQAKGKFGGGKRRAFRQTQKKTQEGNKPQFSTYAIVGNKDGFIGLGYGKAKETVPAREKAFRNAKLNLFKIRRGCGSWECNCQTPHTIPFKATGKCGSVEVTFLPAPKGTGLCVEKECAKMLSIAGIQDVWGKVRGQARTKMNTIKACEYALKMIVEAKVNADAQRRLSVVDGSAHRQTATV